MSAERKPVDVLKVVESCRDRNGMLDADGRYLELCIRNARSWAACGMPTAAADANAAAQSCAFNLLASRNSLRSAGRVPVTQLAGIRTGQRRRHIAASKGAASHG